MPESEAAGPPASDARPASEARPASDSRPARFGAAHGGVKGAECSERRHGRLSSEVAAVLLAVRVEINESASSRSSASESSFCIRHTQCSGF